MHHDDLLRRGFTTWEKSHFDASGGDFFSKFAFAGVLIDEVGS